MRILHLDTGRSMRGGQFQALLLIEGLREHGHDQSLLARAPLLDRYPGRSIGVAVLRREAAKADLMHAHDARAHTLAAVWCWWFRGELPSRWVVGCFRAGSIRGRTAFSLFPNT